MAQAGRKPALTVATKFLEAEIQIYPRLRAHPGLYDNLLAEGRRALAAWRKETGGSDKDDPEFFKSGRKYSYERSYTKRSVVADRYVSILRVDSSYTGGAHPNTGIDAILWDAEAKKRISVRPFFKESADNGPAMTALAEAVRIATACARRAKMNDDKPPAEANCQPDQEELTDYGIKNITPKLVGGIGPIVLAPSTIAGKSAGIVVNYGPYAIGAYAEGAYFPFVHWSKFKDHLSAEGRAIFGGDRPADDPNVN